MAEPIGPSSAPVAQVQHLVPRDPWPTQRLKDLPAQSSLSSLGKETAPQGIISRAVGTVVGVVAKLFGVVNMVVKGFFNAVYYVLRNYVAYATPFVRSTVLNLDKIAANAKLAAVKAEADKIAAANLANLEALAIQEAASVKETEDAAVAAKAQEAIEAAEKLVQEANSRVNETENALNQADTELDAAVAKKDAGLKFFGYRINPKSVKENDAAVLAAEKKYDEAESVDDLAREALEQAEKALAALTGGDLSKA